MANDLTAFNPTIWSKRIIRNLDQINVAKGLVNTDWIGDLSESPTVRVRTLGDITMATYTKNVTTITYQDLVPTWEDFTITDASYFAFKVDDVDQAQSDLRVLDLYTRRAAVKMNNVVNAKILSVYGDAHADNKITNSGGPITLDSSTTQTGATRGIYCVIAQLAEKLSLKNVPETGRFLIVSPVERTLLVNDTTHFVRASALGDAVVMSGRADMNGVNRAGPGFIGQVLGFDVYMVNTLPTTAVGSPVVNSRYMVAGNRDAITYAAQLTEVEAIRLETSFASAVRGLLLHGAKVFAENSKALATAQIAA